MSFDPRWDNRNLVSSPEPVTEWYVSDNTDMQSGINSAAVEG